MTILAEIVDKTPSTLAIMTVALVAAAIYFVGDSNALRVDAAQHLRCLCESGHAPACDWMDWSLWQDKQSREVWVHCSDGVAGVDAWYGPGDASVAAALGAAQPT